MNMVVAKRKHLFESHRPHLFFELRQLSLSPVVRHCRSTVPNNNDTHTHQSFFFLYNYRELFSFSPDLDRHFLFGWWIALLQNTMPVVQCGDNIYQLQGLHSWPLRTGFMCGCCDSSNCETRRFSPLFFFFFLSDKWDMKSRQPWIFFFLWAALHRRPQSLFHLIHQTYV